MSGFDSSEPTFNQKGVWYKMYYAECPQCGSSEEHRTRMPPPRPKDYKERYEYDQQWDYCD